MNLPDTWRLVRLSDVCAINPPLSADERPSPETLVTFVPMAAVDEIDGKITNPETRTLQEVSKGFTPFRESDVLFAKITPSMENGKAAIAANLINGLGFGSTEFHVFRPTDYLLPDYLFYFIRQPSFRDRARAAFVGSAGQQRVPQGFLERVQIPLPTLPEQQRLVAILNQADELRRLQREALEEIQKIPSALFLEMFGDPVTNPKGWPLVRVSSLVRNFQGGKSIESESSNANSVFRVLKVSAVTDLIYKPQESKPLPSNYTPPSEHVVREGDLLFSRANTSELVGAVAYVWETPDNMLLPDKLWRFVWSNPEEIEPLFIWSLFSNPSFQHEIGKRATGTSGSMKNISQEKVLAMQIPFPDYCLQKKFSKFVRKLKTSQDLHCRLHSLTENLFASLQRRAFSGDLTAIWRESHRRELEAVARDRDAALGQPVVKVTVSEFAPAERPWLSQSERYSLMNQLGQVQGFVWEALREWPGTLIPSEDLEGSIRYFLRCFCCDFVSILCR